MLEEYGSVVELKGKAVAVARIIGILSEGEAPQEDLQYGH